MPIEALQTGKLDVLPTKSKPIVYLACPYTHIEFEIRERRFRAATEAAARLIEQGYIVYSPITMTHPIDMVLAGDGATLGSDYWVAFDEAFMAFCAEIVVLTIPGWESSAGIRREIEYFQSHGKPVKYLRPDEKMPT